MRLIYPLAAWFHMKTQFLLLSLVFVLLPINAFAAESSVTIHNSVNTSNSTQSTSTSKCHTHTEVNGKVIDSDDCNVDIHNEGTSVKINNNASPNSNDNSPTSRSTIAPINTPHPTITDDEKEKINKATSEAKQKIEKMKEEQKDFFKKLEDWIKDFFKNLF